MIVAPTPTTARPATAALDTVSAGFEAIFVRMMLKSMREASLGSGILDGSSGASFRDMQDSTVADAIAKRGFPGFGKQITALVK